MKTFLSCIFLKVKVLFFPFGLSMPRNEVEEMTVILLGVVLIVVMAYVVITYGSSIIGYFRLLMNKFLDIVNGGIV